MRKLQWGLNVNFSAWSLCNELIPDTPLVIRAQLQPQYTIGTNPNNESLNMYYFNRGNLAGLLFLYCQLQPHTSWSRQISRPIVAWINNPLLLDNAGRLFFYPRSWASEELFYICVFSFYVSVHYVTYLRELGHSTRDVTLVTSLPLKVTWSQQWVIYMHLSHRCKSTICIHYNGSLICWTMICHGTRSCLQLQTVSPSH